MLLIIQNGFIGSCIFRYLNEEYELVKSFEKDVSKIEIEKYSIVIILGGYQSITKINTYPYLINIIKMIKICIEIKKPIFGICLGCQLIAYALGCQIKSTEKLNIGYDTKIMGYENIFRSHIDYIIPNENIMVMEYFENMPYLYKYNDFIIGIQCHPDVAPECIQKYTTHELSIDYAKKNNKIINDLNSTIVKRIIKYLKKN